MMPAGRMSVACALFSKVEFASALRTFDFDILT